VVREKVKTTESKSRKGMPRKSGRPPLEVKASLPWSMIATEKDAFINGNKEQEFPGEGE